MRLIDADALKADWKMGDKCEKCDRDTRSCHYEVIFSRMDVCSMLDDAPTIDAVPEFVAWLRKIAINNADANKTVTFLEAVEDICNRAETGLRQYLEDCL